MSNGMCARLHAFVAVGDTVDKTVGEMKEAIEFHLEGLRALPIPRPRSIGREIELELPAA